MPRKAGTGLGAGGPLSAGPPPAAAGTPAESPEMRYYRALQEHMSLRDITHDAGEILRGSNYAATVRRIARTPLPRILLVVEVGVIAISQQGGAAFRPGAQQFLDWCQRHHVRILCCATQVEEIVMFFDVFRSRVPSHIAVFGRTLNDFQQLPGLSDLLPIIEVWAQVHARYQSWYHRRLQCADQLIFLSLDVVIDTHMRRCIGALYQPDLTANARAALHNGAMSVLFDVHFGRARSASHLVLGALASLSHVQALLEPALAYPLTDASTVVPGMEDHLYESVWIATARVRWLLLKLAHARVRGVPAAVQQRLSATLRQEEAAKADALSILETFLQQTARLEKQQSRVNASAGAAAAAASPSQGSVQEAASLRGRRGMSRNPSRSRSGSRSRSRSPQLHRHSRHCSQPQQRHPDRDASRHPRSHSRPRSPSRSDDPRESRSFRRGVDGQGSGDLLRTTGVEAQHAAAAGACAWKASEDTCTQQSGAHAVAAARTVIGAAPASAGHDPAAAADADASAASSSVCATELESVAARGLADDQPTSEYDCFARSPLRYHILAFPCDVATTRLFTREGQEDGASSHYPTRKQVLNRMRQYMQEHGITDEEDLTAGDTANLLEDLIPELDADEQSAPFRDDTRMAEDVIRMHSWFQQLGFRTSFATELQDLTQRLDDVDRQLQLGRMLGVPPFSLAEPFEPASTPGTATLHVFLIPAHGVSSFLLASQQRQRDILQQFSHDYRRLDSRWRLYHDLVDASLALGDVVAFKAALSFRQFAALFTTQLVHLREHHLILILDSCFSGVWAQKLREWIRDPAMAQLLRDHQCSITVQTACARDESALGGVFTPLFHSLQDSAWAQRMADEYAQLAASTESWDEFRAQFSSQTPDFVSTLLQSSLDGVQMGTRASAPFETVHGLRFFSNPVFFTFCLIANGTRSAAATASGASSAASVSAAGAGASALPASAQWTARFFLWADVNDWLNACGAALPAVLNGFMYPCASAPFVGWPIFHFLVEYPGDPNRRVALHIHLGHAGDHQDTSHVTFLKIVHCYRSVDGFWDERDYKVSIGRRGVPGATWEWLQVATGADTLATESTVAHGNVHTSPRAQIQVCAALVQACHNFAELTQPGWWNDPSKWNRALLTNDAASRFRSRRGVEWCDTFDGAAAPAGPASPQGAAPAGT